MYQMLRLTILLLPGLLLTAPTAARSAGTKTVLNGIDVLVAENFRPLTGLKIGLITNHTGQDRRGQTTIDLFHESPNVQLLALFSPEHGIRGLKDEKIGDSRDARTGLPIYSLYGERRAPTLEQLQGLDALVFDIQDIGCRFYTYISTMANCMEMAARADLRFILLDRVNPINGITVEGPVQTEPSSFIGYHPIPVRHGMTVGELAGLFRQEKGWKLELDVIRVKGWRRSMWFDETGLKWVNPSPNMRNLNEAILYPGVGLIELTNVSVGRGTATPFEWFGAPWMNGPQLARALNEADLPGVRFQAVTFTPEASKFKGQPCQGVQLTLTDRDAFQALPTGMVIATTLRRLYPRDWETGRYLRLLGHRATFEAVREGVDPQAILELWQKDLDTFADRRARHLLYP